jgi:hypothetical protein
MGWADRTIANTIIETTRKTPVMPKPIGAILTSAHHDHRWREAVEDGAELLQVAKLTHGFRVLDLIWLIMR